MNTKKKQEDPYIYKTRENAAEAKHNEAREFLKTVDFKQLEDLIAQRRQKK